MKRLLVIGLLAGLFFIPTKVKATPLAGDLMTISTDTRFQNRCNYYLQQEAVVVMTEGQGVANHGPRVNYARQILLSGSSQNIQELAIIMLTNSTIASQANLSSPPDWGIQDSTISATIVNYFSGLAGVAP